MRILSPLILIISLAAIGNSAERTSYDEQIKPLLVEKCSACHGALKQEADLRLDAGSLIRAGSESGPVVEPGHSDRSLLIERVSSADVDERMPPEGAGEPLSAKQILLLRSWIDDGADFPEGEVIPGDPRKHDCTYY